jgi:hypothetical protein
MIKVGQKRHFDRQSVASGLPNSLHHQTGPVVQCRNCDVCMPMQNAAAFRCEKSRCFNLKQFAAGHPLATPAR